MRKTLFLSAAAAAMMLAQHSFAGEIIIGGRFASQTVGVEYGVWPADTSGAQAGTLIDFSSNIIYPALQTLTFDTPAYGEMSDTFTHFDYIFENASGIFYEETNATGFLDVNIIFPGHGISSFSFTDVAYAPPPPPVDPPPCSDCDPPPPPCLTCDPPPIVTPGAPEASTWLMLLMGFAGLGFAARHRATARC